MKQLRAAQTTVSALLITAVSMLPALAQERPAAVVDEPVVDLGVVETGATVTHTFVVRNEGGAPLVIREVDPDCGCTVVDYDRNIPPGASGEITAAVDVSTFFGPIAKYLVALTNDVENPELTLAIKVEIRPLVQAHPGYVRFLTVVGDEMQQADQTIWSSDMDDFEVKGVTSPYRFVAVNVREAEEGERRSEGRGRQWVVEVQLSEKAPVGPMADHLVIETNHPSTPVMRVPVSGFVRPVLAATPPFADFGQREVSTPIRASVQIKNFSDDEIALLNVVSSLPEVRAEIVADGDNQYVILILDPGLPKGQFQGRVTVTTDSLRVPRLQIEVRGTVL